MFLALLLDRTLQWMPLAVLLYWPLLQWMSMDVLLDWLLLKWMLQVVLLDRCLLQWMLLAVMMLDWSLVVAVAGSLLFSQYVYRLDPAPVHSVSSGSFSSYP
jgi:hypothetical protein